MLKLEFNSKRIIKSVNNSFLKLTKYLKADIINRDFSEIIDAKFIEEFNDNLKELQYGKVCRGILEIKNKENEIIRLYIIEHPIFDEHRQLAKILFLAIDISKL